jgi:hypothetical protein
MCGLYRVFICGLYRVFLCAVYTVCFYVRFIQGVFYLPLFRDLRRLTLWRNCESVLRTFESCPELGGKLRTVSVAAHCPSVAVDTVVSVWTTDVIRTKGSVEQPVLYLASSLVPIPIQRVVLQSRDNCRIIVND